MARVTCRRRPDGLVEIVPPSALQRFASDFRSAILAAAALALCVVVTVLYTVIGAPVLVVVGGAALGLFLWRRGQAGRRAAAPGAARHRAAAGGHASRP